MHRIFVVIAFCAAAFGGWVLFFPQSAVVEQLTHAGPDASGASSGWALGLLMGLVLAWLATIDWHDLPERFGDWLRLQRRRLTLLVIGGMCASVLLLF